MLQVVKDYSKSYCKVLRDPTDKKAEAKMQKNIEEIDKLQEKLYAEKKEGAEFLKSISQYKRTFADGTVAKINDKEVVEDNYYEVGNVADLKDTFKTIATRPTYTDAAKTVSFIAFDTVVYGKDCGKKCGERPVDKYRPRRADSRVRALHQSGGGKKKQYCHREYGKEVTGLIVPAEEQDAEGNNRRNTRGPGKKDREMEADEALDKIIPVSSRVVAHHGLHCVGDGKRCHRERGGDQLQRNRQKRDALHPESLGGRDPDELKQRCSKQQAALRMIISVCGHESKALHI